MVPELGLHHQGQGAQGRKQSLETMEPGAQWRPTLKMVHKLERLHSEGHSEHQVVGAIREQPKIFTLEEDDINDAWRKENRGHSFMLPHRGRYASMLPQKRSDNLNWDKRGGAHDFEESHERKVVQSPW